MTSLESVSYSKPLSRKSALPSLTHVPCDHTKARLNKVCGSGRWQRGNEDRLEAVAPRAAEGSGAEGGGGAEGVRDGEGRGG